MNKARTSIDSPINLGFLPGPGHVGLTIAPGKRGHSKSGPRWERDLYADLGRLRAHFNIEVLVCLLEDHEIEALRIQKLFHEVEAHGMTLYRLPIPDGGVLPTLDRVERLVGIMTAEVARGRRVAVHCNGGLGRSGTVGGCFLVEHGMTTAEALEALRRARGPNCPETRGQQDFIAAFEARRRTRRLARTEVPHGLDDRFAGAVLGAAIGDAMGHPTEFMDMDSIRARYGPRGVQGFELYWERDGRRFAPYTDDTQMAVAVARGLVEHGASEDLDQTMRSLGRRFVHWAMYDAAPDRSPGNACLSGCRALAHGARWDRAGGAQAGGCGSVMRAYPFGLRFAFDLDRVETMAVAHSKLTHRDPIALAACAAMALGVARSVRGEPEEVVTREMVAAAGRYCARTAAMMARALAEARAGVEPEITLDRLRGWAAHEAIAAAVYLFARHPGDPRAAILEGANTPGDSDSLATLVGALVGARGGLGALPTGWVRDVERSWGLRALASDLALVTAATACGGA